MSSRHCLPTSKRILMAPKRDQSQCACVSLLAVKLADVQREVVTDTVM